MKILLYVEPHPIRDSFEEFSGIGAFLTEALLRVKQTPPIEVRVFSNNAVIDIICEKVPDAAMICERPSGVESKRIDEFKSAWGQKNIDLWIELTNATGPATELYISMLERVYKKYPFDAVILWSENGAVRKFCEQHSIIGLHGELGPTRPPFEETIYFDPAGTNGNAAVRRANLERLALKNLPPETWLGQKSRYENSPDGIGIVDMPYSAVPDELSQLIKFPYIYIPLQLADDLNTIKNSQFSGPLDFLQQVLPEFIKQGYNVVIKPHPGSIHRPHNLIEETRALAFARACGDSVIIIDRKITVSRSTRLIAQSSFVCTINSSVGYEAILLGKHPIVLGNAAYDIGGTLKLPLSKISDLAQLRKKNDLVRKLVNFVSGHFLIPKTEVAKGLPIVKIINLLTTAANQGITPTDDEFWNAWVNKLSYGIDWLGHMNPRAPAVLDSSDQEIFGNIELLSAEQKTVNIAEQSLVISGINAEGNLITGYAHLAPRHFIAHVDHIEPSGKGDNTAIVKGWAMDDELRQASVILAIHNGAVISRHHKIQQRMDVADFIKKNINNASTKTIPSASGFQIAINLNPNALTECLLAFLSADNKLSLFSLKEGRL